MSLFLWFALYIIVSNVNDDNCNPYCSILFQWDFICNTSKGVAHDPMLSIAIVPDINNIGIFMLMRRSYYNIFIGQAWVRIQDHDFLGQGTGFILDIQNPRWPVDIDGCLAHCVQSAKCTGITYAHTWLYPFHRCHFKEVSRWEAQNFNPHSCCDHYDLIRRPDGEKNGIML